MLEWVLHLSRQATRRKQFHHIYDHRGEQRFVGKNAAEAFDFLAEHGPDEFLIRTDRDVMKLRWIDRSPPW